jgi:hypothetical protein
MSLLRAILGRLQILWSHRRKEVVWAILIGVPVAACFAIYFDRSKPSPYKIYIVVGAKTDEESLARLKDSAALKGLEIQGVPVVAAVEHLKDNSPETAEAEAKYLLDQHDLLLVIGNLNSQPTEHSLRVYFEARPQVPFIATVQTDDDLLRECDRRCFDRSKWAPLFQLSPTNSEQAKWAVQFATDNGKRSFLIVHDNDSTNKTYAESLVMAYHGALERFGGRYSGSEPVSLEKHEVALANVPGALHTMEPDCVLYAGGFDDGSALVKMVRESGRRLMVILSDSAVSSQLKDNSKIDRTVDFTDQTDATDYNNHVGVYTLDGIAIAAQLIADLNSRRFDWTFRVKSWFDRQTVEDARRNLARVMTENIRFRSSYRGAAETAPSPDSPTVYAFSGNRRTGGMYHVWEWDPKSKLMADIDHWHPPRLPGVATVTALAASQRNKAPRTHPFTDPKSGVKLASSRNRVSNN